MQEARRRTEPAAGFGKLTEPALIRPTPLSNLLLRAAAGRSRGARGARCHLRLDVSRGSLGVGRGTAGAGCARGRRSAHARTRGGRRTHSGGSAAGRHPRAVRAWSLLRLYVAGRSLRLGGVRGTRGHGAASCTHARACGRSAGPVGSAGRRRGATRRIARTRGARRRLRLDVSWRTLRFSGVGRIRRLGEGTTGSHQNASREHCSFHLIHIENPFRMISVTGATHCPRIAVGNAAVQDTAGSIGKQHARAM